MRNACEAPGCGRGTPIPPERPLSLRAFLGRITRNLALNRLRLLRSDKRGGGQVPLALEELGQCVSGGDDPQDALAGQAVVTALNDFLDGLGATHRALFVHRYFQLEPTAALAHWLGWSQSRVTTTLHRLRGKLKAHLIEEGLEP